MNLVTKVILSGTVLAALPAAAFAQGSVNTAVSAASSVNPHVIMMVHPTPMPVFSPAVVILSANGNVSVNSAKVESVSSSAIDAESSWGSTVINWTIIPSASTTVVGSTTLANIHVGDTLVFTGALDTSAAAFTVDAKTIRDGAGNTVMWAHPSTTSALQGSASGTVTMNGTVTTALPRPTSLFGRIAARLGISL